MEATRTEPINVRIMKQYRSEDAGTGSCTELGCGTSHAAEPNAYNSTEIENVIRIWKKIRFSLTLTGLLKDWIRYEKDYRSDRFVQGLSDIG